MVAAEFDINTHQKKASGRSILEGFIFALALAMFVYQIVFVVFRPTDMVELQIYHLIFAFTLIYGVEISRSKKNWHKILLTLLLGVSTLALLYLRVFQEELEMRTGFPTNADTVIGLLLIMNLFFITQRVWGWIIPIVALTFLLYAILGQHIPFSKLAAPQVSWDYVINYLTTGLSGMIGHLLGVGVYYIFFFVILGGLLGSAGVPDLIYEFGKILCRRIRSGGAQVAIWGSALMGTATGTVVANVLLTGSFTIPLMKKMGYKPEFAGAIEAVASTGGQIMPPIMGSGAFVMVYFLGVDYFDVVLAAVIPAFLYFLCLAIGVHLLAGRDVMAKQTQTEPVNRKVILRRGVILVIIMTILMLLLVKRYSATYAGTITIAVLFVAMILDALIFHELLSSLKNILKALKQGVIMASQISMILALLGVVAKIVTATGIGVTLSSFIYYLGQGLLLPTVMMTAVLVAVLGMGLPSAAAYTIGALVAGPGLIRLGLKPFAVHFSLFFVSVLGHITPPVATGSLVASRVADTDFWKTSWAGCKLAIPILLLPFALIYNPALLGKGSILSIFTQTTIAIGMVLFTQISMWGFFLNRLDLKERLIAGLVAVAFAHDMISSQLSPLLWIGVPLSIVFLGWQIIQNARRNHSGKNLKMKEVY